MCLQIENNYAEQTEEKKRAAIALAINNLFRLTNTHWAKFAVVVVQIFAHNDINGHVLAWRKFGACLSQHDINKTS